MTDYQRRGRKKRGKRGKRRKEEKSSSWRRRRYADGSVYEGEMEFQAVLQAATDSGNSLSGDGGSEVAEKVLLKHGKGTLIDRIGNRFTGRWQHDKAEGYRQRCYIDILVYTTPYHDEYRHGM